MKYVFWAIFLYFLYRFITGFVIPLYRTTRQVKKQFGAMREQMEQEQARNNGFNNHAQQTQQTNADNILHKTSKPVGSKEDYIEYEDIK